ncbi:MAG: hypothetical protein ACRDG7_06410, partial [Candidatus Limnocylindria bacterium]
MYDIVGKRNLWFVLSAILTIPGLLFIILGGLRPSIDFTGGTEWEVRYADAPPAAEMSATLAELGYEDALVTQLSDGFLRIRTDPIDLTPAETPAASPSASASVEPSASAERSASAEPSGGVAPSASPSVEPSPAPIAEGTEFADLEDQLEEAFGPGEPRSVRTVGPIIGADLIRSSAILIIIGELFLLGYLWM